MAKRRSIGLIFFFDNSTNSGIVNYIYNIVAALKRVPLDKQPKIVLFYSSNAPIDYLKEIGYQDIQFIYFAEKPRKRVYRLINEIILKSTGKDLFKYFKYFRKIDCLYPYFEFRDQAFKGAPKKIHWLVDFNAKVFGHHYNKDILEVIENYQKKITSQSQEKVVLSSNTLFLELKKYYPDYKCEINILRFASTVPKTSLSEVIDISKSFDISAPYFITPNQFWEHKNQIIILEAVNLVRKINPEIKFKILFTGSLEVHRGVGRYVDLFRSKLDELCLGEYIRFLGVLKRSDQLALMNGAIAVIQPSLYEGWSTLVEESKALSKTIILTDLPVHREQIDSNALFFDPNCPDALAYHIIQVCLNPPKISPVNYEANLEEFSQSLLRVLN